MKYLDHPACMDWPVPSPGTTVAQWQAQRCAGCGVSKRQAPVERGEMPPPPRRDGLVMDHDHHTGLERGYLCRRCNHLTEKRVPLWTRWRSGWNPATILGEQEPYSGIGWHDGANTLDAMYPEPTMDELREAINRLPSSA